MFCKQRISALHCIAVLLGGLVMPDCFAAGSYMREDPRIVVTIDSAKYLHLTGGAAKGDKREPSSMYRRFVGHLEDTYGLKHVEDWPLPSLGETMLVFANQTGQSAGSVAETVEQQNVINTAQAVNRMRVAANRTSGAANVEPLAWLQENLAALGLASSHNWATGRGVRVAIIDTGVDRRHPELRGRIERSVDFTGKRKRNFDSDIHGTAIASIIAGARDNRGMLGIAPDATLIVLKACGRQAATEERAVCDTVTLAKALNDAIEQAPGVINLSLSGPQDPLLTRLLREAIRHNITVVAAVSENKDEHFPAGVDGVLGVSGGSGAAVRRESNGPVLAPSRFIVGALPGGDYDYFSGNSAAAAQISGVVALLLQRKPHLAPDVIARLLASASRGENGFVHACDTLARIVGVPCDDTRIVSR